MQQNKINNHNFNLRGEIKMQTKNGCFKQADLSRDQVLADIKSIVAEMSGVNIEVLQEKTRFEADLNFDSLERVEFAMEIEEHFDITVSDEMEEQIQSIGDVVDGVMNFLNNSHQ
jgi:acyl carrier protein